ncbi:SRPBCC domain-containing protein [Pseudoxanthomonas sp. LjRoot125]|uniref:SRPBCC family protein n=1 Tax=Pseudoxanthomonas sp. LjRoot125 TaxID=3342258 RepID=UPI003E11A8A1
MKVPPSTDTVDVSVQRVFPVPAERVFDAWLTPRLLGQWMFGPGVRDEKVLRLDVDPRVGGRFSMLVERGGQRIDHVGEYLVIDRPHRLSFTWGIAGESDQDGSRVDIVIAPTPMGCELRLTHALPRAWADYADRTQQGWAHMLGALHALF